MALLQISEPGMMPAPHQRKLAVGIDLGTTNSLVATVRSSLAETLADEQGNMLLPSVVFYDNHLTLVGEEALQQATISPAETIISVKRLIGRSLTDIKTRYPQLPYEFIPSENGLPLIKTKQGTKNPIQVSSDILTKLAARASDSLGGELEGVVITVPAYFDDAQRQATKDAATLAGLNVLRLLNEPTAAAVAYGLDSGQEGIIAVYDLGGGTFDISILRLSRGVFEVLATGGDSALGGDDFDHLLANWLAEQMNLTEQSANSLSLQREILEAAVEAKHALTDVDQVIVTVSGIAQSITKIEFEVLIQPLVQKTLMVCRRSLRDAGLMNEEIKEVVMVGGSTRVPLVREMVGEFFNRTPLTSIDPDRVVAIGAALQADSLVGNKPDGELLLLDVIPLSLGIETMGGLVEKIIPRNTTIPISRAQEFTTFKDGQTAMSIHVLQGERELVSDCRSLAKFSLKGIPPMAAGGAHIRVAFQVDADGLLSVSAMEKSTGVQAQIQVKPSYGLTEDEIAQMLIASIEHAKDDVTQRLVIEKRVDAQRLVESVEVALAVDSSLLSQDELFLIEQALDAVKMIVLRQQNHTAKEIDQAVDRLSHVTESFAAKRMNESVQNALKGQSIDQI